MAPKKKDITKPWNQLRMNQHQPAFGGGGGGGRGGKPRGKAKAPSAPIKYSPGQIKYMKNPGKYQRIQKAGKTTYEQPIKGLRQPPVPPVPKKAPSAPVKPVERRFGSTLGDIARGKAGVPIGTNAKKMLRDYLKDARKQFSRRQQRPPGQRRVDLP